MPHVPDPKAPNWCSLAKVLQIVTLVHEHVRRVPVCCVCCLVRWAIIQLYFAVINDAYFLIIILNPFGIGTVRPGERPVVAVIHSTAVVHNYAFEVVCVVVAQLLLVIPECFLLRLLCRVAVPAQQYQFFGAHVRRTLQIFIVFEVKVGESVDTVRLVTCILVRASCLIIFILRIFYFLRLMIYLIILDVQQRRERYSII